MKSEMHKGCNSTDRAIINRLQLPLPLASRPFEIVSRELGISEEELLERSEKLLCEGFFTRFGPFIDAQAMGGAFCLCAMAVPPERFDETARIVNSFPEVAHNYEREHSLNMWFVLATCMPGEIASTAEKIEAATECKVLMFPKEREYFVGFTVTA